VIGLGRDEHQGVVIRPLGGVPIDGVVAEIGFAADEPLGEGRAREIERLGERLVPVDALGFVTQNASGFSIDCL
jgi:hypothetical protein